MKTEWDAVAVFIGLFALLAFLCWLCSDVLNNFIEAVSK